MSRRSQMRGPNAADYAISDADADELKGAALLPYEFRLKLLRRYQAKHGAAALVRLFAQFIGMANSVASNAREMAEALLITEGNMHPHQAEKANLPTIFGALNGVALAASVKQEKTCPGCAFRLGTPANQSPVTTCDAEWCQNEGESDFMCHERLDDCGNPSKLCIGYAQRAKLTKSRAKASPFARGGS